MKSIKPLNILHFFFVLLKDGALFDFLKVVKADRSNAEKRTLLKQSCEVILRKYTKSSPFYFMALECLAETNLREHHFELAGSQFSSAIRTKKEFLKGDLSGDAHVYNCYAACYYNMGDRDKTVDIIHEAISNGIDPQGFSGLIDVEKLNAISNEKGNKAEEGRGCGNER